MAKQYEKKEGMGLVVVGCGGVTCAAIPYLTFLVAKYKPNLFLVDPDVLEGKNFPRQWPASKPLSAKTDAAYELLTGHGHIPYPSSVRINKLFHQAGNDIAKQLEGMPVLVACAVDNDHGRADVREWASARWSPTVVVVAGCQEKHGQVVTGLYQEAGPVIDWAKNHPDLMPQAGVDPKNTANCGVQTFRSNGITGALLGQALQDGVAYLEDGLRETPQVMEYFWEYLQVADNDPVFKTYSKWVR